MAERIYFRGSRALAMQVVGRLSQSMTGSSSSYTPPAQGVHRAMGIAALSDSHADSVRKARGGTGDDGVIWPPLKPATLA